MPKSSVASWHLFLRDNSLSLTLFSLFALFLAGMAAAGYIHTNQELASHHQATQSLGQYLASGDFIEAVFENWESEFLQMGALVVLTIFLRQKGSADSKKLTGSEPVDTSSRSSIIRASSWRRRRQAIKDALYGNSLSIALFGLFALAFALHAIGGTQAHNETALQHGETAISVWTYLTTAQFWFESFQNWQSEFLAVGTLLILSIFLRQRGSPESKTMSETNKQTGGV